MTVEKINVLDTPNFIFEVKQNKKLKKYDKDYNVM
jgi:hypothetical protein